MKLYIGRRRAHPLAPARFYAIHPTPSIRVVFLGPIYVAIVR